VVDESKFEIWFNFRDNPYQETGELGRSWGRFGFGLDRTQLFQRIDADAPGWEGNLVYLYDWLKGGLWEKIVLFPLVFTLGKEQSNITEKQNYCSHLL